METSKVGTSRGPWFFLCAALLALPTAGCIMKKQAVAPESPVPRDTGVDVVLLDGTRYLLTKAQERDGEICGSPVDCGGPSCTRVAAEGCVPRGDVATLRARKVDAAATAAVIAAVALGAVATVAVVTAVSSGGTRSSGTGSGGTGTGSGSGSGSRSGLGIGSCPRVYSWDGARFRLDSGTFGLSYFEAAPRTDFDRLDYLAADRGKYRLRLVNEEQETEHTDLVRLLVVDHPKGARVVPSASGKVVTFRDEVAPIRALDFRGADARALVTTTDDREWSSDPRGRDADRAEDARDGLRLVFPKPRDATIAKLRVAAHNTSWAGEMLGYMLAQRGRTLPAWFAKMNAEPTARAELIAFLIREGMLSVRVKRPSGWVESGVFWAAGREIVKEEAFEISVTDIPDETVEIELESALEFWSIDMVSMAFGRDEPTVVRELSPISGRTNDGRDVAEALARVDGVRFDTVRGDVAELTFDAPPEPAPGWTRSFVLETNGHDVPEVEPSFLPNPAAMDALITTPFAASRLALALRIASLK